MSGISVQLPSTVNSILSVLEQDCLFSRPFAFVLQCYFLMVDNDLPLQFLVLYQVPFSNLLESRLLKVGREVGDDLTILSVFQLSGVLCADKVMATGSSVLWLMIEEQEQWTHRMVEGSAVVHEIEGLTAFPFLVATTIPIVRW